MDIRLIGIKEDQENCQAIRQLYHSSFPADERAPFGMLLRGARKKNVDFFSCHDGSEWIGMIYVVNYLDLSYVFYFAVDERKRGMGYGTAILHAAQKYYQGRRFFLAIEEIDEKYQNYSQRLNRLHFYERAGFQRTGQKMQEGKVIYDLMSNGGRIRNEDYRKLIRTFAGFRMLFFTMKILND